MFIILHSNSKFFIQFKDDLLIQHDPAEKNITRLSDVASIRLYNPQTLAELSVSGLANPVTLRFPIDDAEMYENYTKEVSFNIFNKLK